MALFRRCEEHFLNPQLRAFARERASLISVRRAWAQRVLRRAGFDELWIVVKVADCSASGDFGCASAIASTSVFRYHRARGMLVEAALGFRRATSYAAAMTASFIARFSPTRRSRRP